MSRVPFPKSMPHFLGKTFLLFICHQMQSFFVNDSSFKEFLDHKEHVFLVFLENLK